MEQRTQFTFYASIYESACRIKNKAARADFYDAICAYALAGTPPDLDKLSDAAAVGFIAAKPNLDIDIRLSIEGRRSEEYKNWRRSVFERDNYTCRSCGARGCRLNAHHIKAYAFFPDLRYEVTNGLTLCEICHKAIHKRRRRT